MTFRSTSLLLASSALSFALVAAPALAQDAVDPNTGEVQPEVDEGLSPAGDSSIVVTGTRIVRDGYTAPTPVTVALTEELQRATPTNIPDALNKLPQFQNSLSPARSASNFANFPIHGNVLNLRGLGTPTNNPKGPLRTLVMFEGVRVPPTTYVGTVDSNVIPNLLIQRVDVVTGGASAAYGSDAVAGVVNFVLDRKYTGIKGQAQAGVSERGDNENQRLGLAFGTPFAGNRGHLLVSAEYFNNGGMRRDEREVGTQSFTYIGSNATCVNTTTDPTACAPGGSLNPYTIGQNVRITATSDFGTISGPAGFPLARFTSVGDGTFRPFQNGLATGTPGYQIGGDGYTIPSKTAAIKPYTTYQGFGRLSYEVSDGVEVFAQGIYSRTDLSYDALGNSLVTPVTIYKGNPFIPPTIDALLPAGGSFTFQQYTPQHPSPHVEEQTDFWMVTGGLEAQLGRFNASLSYTHGESEHDVAQAGLYDWRNLFAAVDAVRDSSGNITCRVLTNPAVASQYAGCQPLDVLRGPPASTSPAGYAYATGASRYNAVIKQDSVVGTISGSLFELPAGPVDIAVGAEYRKQTLDLTSNADPALLDTAAERDAYFNGLRGVAPGVLFFWLTNVGVAQGEVEVKEAFGEIAVPLLRDTPGFQELSLNGAVRVTDYSTSGTVTTWKAGATWKPIEDLLLRGTYSRDIRAPNLFELFRGDTSGIGIVLDPVTGINQNIPTVSGGNPNLVPEVAKTLTFGGVISPRALGGFSLAVDYYNIKLDGAIDSLSSTQIINNCFNFGPSTPECALITRPTATSFPTQVRISEANISFLETSGIDIDASYRTALGNGLLNLRLYANYLIKFDTQQFAGQPVLEYAGINVVSSNPVSYPRWRGMLSLDYSTDNFGITISEQYIHRMRLGIPGQNQNFVDDRVPTVLYTDLSLRWMVPHGDGKMEFFTTVNNLFDKDPPLIPSTVPGVNFPTNISTYDVVGRSYIAGVRFNF